MAKKQWEGNYSDLNIDSEWNGLPGNIVQRLIKDEFSSKVGYIDTKDDNIFFSATKDDFENGRYIGSVLSKPLYRLETKRGDGKKIFLSTDTNKIIKWYFKTVYNNGTEKEPIFNETINAEYIFENGNSKKFLSSIININPDNENNDFTLVSLNVDEYLLEGTNKITINIKGTQTNTKAELIFDDIKVIRFELEDKTEFNQPYLYNTITLYSKIISTEGQSYYYYYRFDEEGDFIMDEQSYSKGGDNVSKIISFKNEMADGKHVLEYRLMTIINGDKIFTKIQRIEFVKGELSNLTKPEILISTSYSDEDTIKQDGIFIINGVLQYIPYSLKFAVLSNSNTKLIKAEISKEETNSVPSIITLNQEVDYGLYEIQEIKTGLVKVGITLKDANDKIIEGSDKKYLYLNVETSNISIEIDDDPSLRIDFTSIGKTNNSEDKEKWESQIEFNGIRNKAIFNEDFEWSQGWTENGLVIGNGCEVTFDYVPFPSQKSTDDLETKNEYVGGDKAYTFEIEFMTQNVTNENVILCDLRDYNKDDSCGLEITASQIKFTTPNGKTVKSRFKSNEMNRAVIIIRPQYGGKDGKTFRGLVELYMNGVLTNVTSYSEDERFIVRDEDGASKFLSFKGKKGADIVIKYIRAYRNYAMKRDNVVNNYILNRGDSKRILELFNKNNVFDENKEITPESILKLGNIPVLLFVGRTPAKDGEERDWDYATGDGNETENEDYLRGDENLHQDFHYETLEKTTSKDDSVEMDVIFINPEDDSKNFKFVKALIKPQGTSSMYYPKKNYRIYTQKNKDTRMFLSNDDNTLTYELMKKSNFGENPDDRKYEVHRGKKNYKKRLYSFKKNAQPVNCWCLKADFAETSSSHNTGIARLWNDTLKTSVVSNTTVFKTNAQNAIELKYKNNEKNMPDVRTTIDGFPIVVFASKSYDSEFKFLGKYNFNNDKSTESVFGFCDIDDSSATTFTYKAKDYDTNEETQDVEASINKLLDKYMTCVETLDNGNPLANFYDIDTFDEEVIIDDKKMSKWETAFEFRYPEMPEKPKASKYENEADYKKAVEKYDDDKNKWINLHLNPFRHFAKWVNDTRWCDINGNVLSDLTSEEAKARKDKFYTEKWDHLDVWKVAAYYVYVMRFGAVDQIVKNSMLTSEGPFAYGKDLSERYGHWDNTEISSENYGQYYKWYYINYDNDTIMGVKNDGSLAYGPDITRKTKENSTDEKSTYVYAGFESTLWNNLDADEEFQRIVRQVDQSISDTMPYSIAINEFDNKQVGQWCERIYNKDAEYKYISPFTGGWEYGDTNDKNAQSIVDMLYMLQGSRTAHRRWWLSNRFSFYDGKWGSGDYPTKFISVKCNYSSKGDKFNAKAGSTSYYGYIINNVPYNGKINGETFEYKEDENIEWELWKNVQIGDPITMYGAINMKELNLEGLSQNLAVLTINFGDETDMNNKLETLNLSVPDNLILAEKSYESFYDDEENGKTAFEKFYEKYHIDEKEFEENGKYYNPENIDYDANDENSKDFYRIELEKEGENGEKIYVYFAKIDKGVRNTSCTGLSLDNLINLQTLKIAGYEGLKEINLVNNPYILNLDVRYSGIGKITFNNKGCNITNLYASNSLNTLQLSNCGNIKIDNIKINNNSLLNDGGYNINDINIDSCDKLLNSNDFRKFLMAWIKNANEENSPAKNITLKGIKWNNVNMNEINSLLEFQRKNTNRECNISGKISLANINITSKEYEIIKDFENTFKIKVSIPYINILIEKVNPIVAGESVVLKSNILTDSDSEGYIISYKFVEKVDNIGEADLYNQDTGEYYKYISDISTIRNGSVHIDSDNGIISTDETIFNEDITILVAVICKTTKGYTRFDTTQLKIEDPTYATEANILGTVSLNEQNKEYTYVLNLKTNNGDTPKGTVDKIWNINGDGIEYIASSSVTSNGNTLKLITKNELPETISKFNIEVFIDNCNGDDFSVIKNMVVLNQDIILTKESNPIVMGICHKSGLAASDQFMTKEEAKKVTDIGTYFKDITSEKWSFEEFEFFTNSEFTTIGDNAFSNSSIVSIKFPQNINNIGTSIFENCEDLEIIYLSEGIKTISRNTFKNCKKLKSFVLPKSVTEISEYAFGGTNMKKILFDGESDNTSKVIYLHKDSELISIKNNAFEIDGFDISIVNDDLKVNTTNHLEIITIPKNLILDFANYNFLLSKELNTVYLHEENDSINYDNNIIYNNGYEIFRAVPKCEKINNIIDLTSITNVYDYAFFNCESIGGVKLGGSLRNNGLGKGAFLESKIKHIDLSECNLLKVINELTFYNMELLETLNLPDTENSSLILVKDYIFNGSKNLRTLNLPDTIMFFDGTKNKKNYSYFITNCGITSFKIPELVTSCPLYLIRNCSELKEFSFSSYYKFSNNNYSLVYKCEKLTDVKLPLFSTNNNKNKQYYIINNKNEIISGPYEKNEATTFLNNLLENYNSIKQFITNDELKKFNFEISEVYLNNNNHIVINDSFYKTGHITTFESCNKISKFILNSKDNKLIMSVTNDGVDNHTKEDDISQYEGKSIIKVGEYDNLNGKITPLDEDKKILIKIVYSASAYKTPAYISSYGDGAFAHTSISSVTIDDKIEKMSNGLFAFTSNLSNVNMPNNIKILDEYCFYKSNIGEVKFSNNITSIGSFSFNTCKNLRILELPDNITEIGKAVFSNCSNLTSIKMPKYLNKTEDGDKTEEGLFENCTSLKSLTLYEDVNIISKRLCFGCHSLETVELLSSNISEIKAFAFVDCNYLSKFIINTSIPPKIDGESINSGGYYDYHPFGYKNNFMGASNGNGVNKFYVPYGSINDYENDKKWKKPLLDENACKFTIEENKIIGELIIKGVIIQEFDMVYISNERNTYTETLIKEDDNTFSIILNGEVFDNEIINFYKDENFEELIGSIIVKYGKNEYTLDVISGALNNSSLFSTNLYNIDENDDIIEMAQITKKEYDILLAKINKLTRLINLKK